jgi:hypothetical protein
LYYENNPPSNIGEKNYDIKKSKEERGMQNSTIFKERIKWTKLQHKTECFSFFLSFKGMKYELGVGIHHHSRRNEGTFFKKREKNTNELKTVSLL